MPCAQNYAQLASSGARVYLPQHEKKRWKKKQAERKRHKSQPGRSSSPSLSLPLFPKSHARGDLGRWSLQTAERGQCVFFSFNGAFSTFFARAGARTLAKGRRQLPDWQLIISVRPLVVLLPSTMAQVDRKRWGKSWIFISCGKNDEI